MKTFLIGPVRGYEGDHLEKYVRWLEKNDFEVYWPATDTNQVDDTGYRICQDNLDAMIDCDVVHFVWDGKSQGSLFDLGMAFALGKPLRVIKVPEETEGKSFQNMAKEWEKETQLNDKVEVFVGDMVASIDRKVIEELQKEYGEDAIEILKRIMIEESFK